MTTDDVYVERLWPPPWLWLAAFAWSAMVGWAVGYATSGSAGWLVAIAAATLSAVGLVDWSATVRVDATGVTAGSTHLPASCLGPVCTLDARQARALRGVDADARAFLWVRGWIATGVRLDVADPVDPTPYWYLSSRHPERLAAAIDAARATDRRVQ